MFTLNKMHMLVYNDTVYRLFIQHKLFEHHCLCVTTSIQVFKSVEAGHWLNEEEYEGCKKFPQAKVNSEKYRSSGWR